jgi:hypothetical protein
MNFEDYFILQEAYTNIFSPQDKQKWKDVVWEIIQKSYRPIGGIKGSGFESPDDMVNKLPMWKIFVSGGKVRAVVLYKDKGGRKLVAIGTDGSNQSKKAIVDILKIEFSRSYSEISGPLLSFIKRYLPDVVNTYGIPFEQAKEIALRNGDHIEPVQDSEFEYLREINRQMLRKMMIGTIGKSIY